MRSFDSAQVCGERTASWCKPTSIRLEPCAAKHPHGSAQSVPPKRLLPALLLQMHFNGVVYEPIGIILARCVGTYPGKFSEFKCGSVLNRHFPRCTSYFSPLHRIDLWHRCPWRILGASAPMEDRSNRWFPSHRALDHGPRPLLDFSTSPLVAGCHSIFDIWLCTWFIQFCKSEI